MRHRYLLLFVVLHLFLLDAIATEAKIVKIGVLSFRPPTQTYSQWQPTADYLSEHIKGYNFQVIPLNYPQIEEAVAKGEVDFVTTNPAHYVVLESLYGATRIATLIRTENNNPAATLGGVIFTKSNRNDINTLEDLKGKKVAGVQLDALGGYVSQIYELQKAGVKQSSFAKFTFTGQPHDKVVSMVLSGETDVGMVRTGVLEWMEKEGKIKLSDIKVLSGKNDKSYPFLLSTKLYPEWPFAGLKHTPNELSTQVLVTLLDINRNSQAAILAGYSGWTVPLDYEPVHELLRTLKLRPYEKDTTSTKAMVVMFWPWFVGGAALIFTLSFFIYRENRTNRILKETQAKLQENEAHLHAIIENEPECIKIVDENCKLVQMNPAGLKMIEADSLEQVVGKPVLGVIDPRYHEDYMKMHTRVLAGEAVRMRYETQGLKGGRRWLETHAAPMRENGKTVHIAITRDITEHLAMEENLRNINKHLHEMVGEETAKLLKQEKLLIQQSKMAMMGEMIGAIAHQWRQPLTSLGITVQDVPYAYRFGELNEEYLDRFKTEAMDKINAMSKTIDDFRDFFSPNKKEEQFFIEDAIGESLKMLDAQLKINGVKVMFDIDQANKHSYTSYKNELKQVLLNILGNAKDALLEKKQENPFVKIDITADKESLKIGIEDSAGGIAEAIIDRVFDSHFTTKEEGKGTGIGLYMSKQIVEESLGGKLSVKNSENGARFVIELPVV